MMAVIKRYRKLIITLGAIIVVVPVLVWLGSRYDPGRYQPIGDELFDRYAELVIRDVRAFERRPSEIINRVLGRSILDPTIELPFNIDYAYKSSMEEILDWEEEFVNDPRYWQLRYTAWLDDDPKEMLLKSMESGVADRGTYYLLCTRLVEEVHRDFPERAMKLVEQAIALDPDNSYFYYVKATLKLAEGRIEETLALLQKGNSAPRNEVPVEFPYTVLVENIESFTAEDNVLVAQAAYISHFPNVADISMSFNISTMHLATKGRNLLLLEEIIKFNLRLFQMDNQSFSSQKMAVLDATILLHLLTKEGSIFNDEQTDGLKTLIADLKEIRALYKTQNESTDWESVQSRSHFWDIDLKEMAFVEEMKAEVEKLSVPPLARWAEEAKEEGKENHADGEATSE